MLLKIQQLIKESLKYIAYTYQFIWRQKMIQKTQSIFVPRTSYPVPPITQTAAPSPDSFFAPATME